jgi:hypothetical protein
MGAFCGEGDVCSPDEPTNQESEDFSCHQNCTEEGSVCDEGTCTQFQGVFFCL